MSNVTENLNSHSIVTRMGAKLMHVPHSIPTDCRSFLRLSPLSPVVVMSSEPNLPWVEKYRPSNLEDLISHEDIIKTIDTFIEQDNFPHLLLYGPPGTGKTSTVLACARKMFNAEEFKSMVLELNASDDRGIGIVRGDILNFAEARSIFNKSFKLIILDEADAMTNDAQNALRRIMEKYTNVTRFCLICNYLSKITPAIQSRCTRFRFAPLMPEQICSRLEYIIGQEGVKATGPGKEALMQLAGGDMRRVINGLQSTHLAFGVVDENTVYKCCGQPTRQEMNELWSILTDDEDVKSNLKRVLEIQALKGLALQDMIYRLQFTLHEIDEIAEETKMDILLDMAEIDVQLSSGGEDHIQAAALVGCFYKAAKALWQS